MPGSYHYDSLGYEIYRNVNDTRRHDYVIEDSLVAEGYEYAPAQSYRTGGTSSSSGCCNCGLVSLAGLIAGLALLRKE